MIVDKPVFTPPTPPLLETVVVEVGVQLQLPPGVGSVSVITDPLQTIKVPAIGDVVASTVTEPDTGLVSVPVALQPPPVQVSLQK